MHLLLRKYYSIAATLLLLSLLYGCSKYDDYLYCITRVSLSNGDNSTGMVADTPVTTAPAKAYVLKLYYETKLCGTTGKYFDKNESYDLLTSAVTSVNVYSLTAFDATHPALSTLNDYFLLDYDSLSKPAIQHILIYGGSRNGDPGDSTGSDTQLLKLMVPPATLGYRQFVMDIRLNDSTQFLDTTGVTLY